MMFVTLFYSFKGFFLNFLDDLLNNKFEKLPLIYKFILLKMT